MHQPLITILLPTVQLWHVFCSRCRVAWEPRCNTMNLPIRTAGALGFLLVLSLPARALPVSTSSVDRDVVRNPYNSFSLNLSKGPVIAVPSVSTGFGSSVLPMPTAAGFSGSSSINGFLTSSLPFSFVPPPRNPQVYFSLYDQPRQTNVTIGPVQVPEGGVTLL